MRYFKTDALIRGKGKVEMGFDKNSITHFEHGIIAETTVFTMTDGTVWEVPIPFDMFFGMMN